MKKNLSYKIFFFVQLNYVSISREHGFHKSCKILYRIQNSIENFLLKKNNILIHFSSIISSIYLKTIVYFIIAFKEYSVNEKKLITLITTLGCNMSPIFKSSEHFYNNNHILYTEMIE